MPSLFSVFLIVLIAFLFKVGDIKELLQKDNVLSCYDCFRYALITEQRLEGTLSGINYLANVPDYSVNTESKTLITYIALPFVKWFGVEVKDIYVVLPPLLGTFFVIPLYLWVRKLGGTIAYIGASLLGVFNLIYWIRTSPGRYDTDFLILTFLFSTLWLITLLSEERDFRKSVALAVLTGMTMQVFMWWYPKPIFIFLFSLSLLAGSLLFGSGVKLTLAKVLLFIVSSGMGGVLDGLRQLFFYIESRVFYEPSSFVPVSISKAVVELQPLDFGTLVKFTSDNPIFVVIGFGGLIYLFVKKFKYMVIALPFIAMGLSAFMAGNRMLMYLAPFLGLGIGFAVESVYRFFAHRFTKFKLPLGMGFLILVIAMSFPPYVFAVKKRQLFTDEFYKEVQKLKELTPEGSFIWTWWDFGNLIQYSARRGTFIDNGNWNIVKTYAIAHSFILKDPVKARNLVAYVSNTLQVSQKYSGLGYKTFLRKAYTYEEKINRNTYILMSPNLLTKLLLREIGSYGTKLKPEFEPVGSEVFFCNKVGGLVDCGIISFLEEDLKILSLKFKVSNVVFYDRTNGIELKSQPIDSANRTLLVVKWRGKYFATLIDNELVDSNLVNWYILRKYSEKYFELVYDNFPMLVLYKVR